MGSVHAFLDAAGTFVEHLGDVNPLILLAALGLHLTNLLLRTRAWLNILRAAFPHISIRWGTAIGAYGAGVGVNAFAPARGGDIVKVTAVRRRTGHGSVPTIAASLLVETVFDLVVATALLTWAYTSGRLPALPDIPDAPAFEWSFFARHTQLMVGIVIVASIGGSLALRWLARHVRAFWGRVAQGVTILRTPVKYLALVASYQAVGWLCRAASAYLMLDAFGVEATIANALLVLVVGSLATLLPITPGGAGAQQALLVIVLAGAASQSQVLAYSVGAQVAVTAVNAMIGALAVLAIFKSLRLRGIRSSSVA